MRRKLCFSFLAVAGVVSIMIACENTSRSSSVSMLRKKCAGYTVLEAGKGIDCNGDTVKLITRPGFYELSADKVQ